MIFRLSLSFRHPSIFSCVAILGLFRIATGLAAPPGLSDQTFFPGDRALAPAAGRQFLPKIAAGDNLSLLVWVDCRAAITDVGTFVGGGTVDAHVGSMMDVYAARMDASGSLIDQSPIVVAQAPKNQGLPEVAWNGENWLVVWTGQTGLTCCPQSHRYAARVSREGTVLDSPPILLAAYPDAEAEWPAAAGSDGTNWLVVWAGRSSPTSFVVRAMRIAPNGSILDPGGVVIASGGYPGDFDVAFAGGEYFVIWSTGGMTSGGAVLGQRLTPNLAPIGSPVTINRYSPSVGLNCRVATDGTDYFVAWWENRYAYWSQLAGARVSRDGVVLDPNGIFLTAAEGTTNYEPSVGWDGTNYIVVYDRSNFPPIDLFATRVTRAGVVLDYDTGAIPISTAPEAQMQSDIAKLPGGGSLIVWRDNRHTPVASGALGDIFATTLSTNRKVGSDRCVSLGAPAQTLLRLAANGSGYVAVYRSETSLETRIVAQRLDAAGSALDAEPVTVVAGGRGITNPSVAWNHSVYMVVWEDDFTDQTWGRRLDANLAPIDPAPFAVMRGNMPDVAALGDVFLIVTSWEEPHEIRRIYSVRVRGSDGTILDPTPVPVSPWSFSLYPRVAAVGSRWLVVWQQHTTHDNPSSQANGSFVEPSGTAGSLIGVDGSARRPAVAGAPNQALIVFDGRTDPGFQRDIFARRILPDGTYLDPIRGIVVTHELEPQFEPAVAWDGSGFVAAYADFRNESQTPRGDLFAARVTDGGVVLDPTGFAVAADTIPEMFPAAAGLGGEFIVGGSVFRPGDGVAAYRIGVRTFRLVVAVQEDAMDRAVPGLSTRPNPFNSSTTIRFHLAARTSVTLRVVDVRGTLVRELIEGVRDAGGHAVPWDGTNDRGQAVASGVYFVSLDAGRFQQAKKLVVLK